MLSTFSGCELYEESIARQTNSILCPDFHLSDIGIFTSNQRNVFIKHKAFKNYIKIYNL